MELKDIYQDIRLSFSDLWTCKERGRSLEIITPYATTSQQFVSVFLSCQDGEYIVSDGGWLDNGLYDNAFNQEDDIFRKIVQHYCFHFDIREVKGPNQKSFFYKKTGNAVAVPSLVFDLSNFIAVVISTSGIEFTEKEERETKERFRRIANEFLQTIVPKEKMDLGGFVDDKRQVRLSAIIKKTSSRLILVNYITGSNQYYFNNSITKANFLFELADKSGVGRFVERKISLIDNTAAGFIPAKVTTFINHLLENTNSAKVDWSERDQLKSYMD